MSGPTEKKVAFVIAGAQKAGTTALDRFLRQHPSLGMPERKETHFFNTDAFFMDATPDYRPYHTFFDGMDPTRIWGEATPAYMYCKTVPARIAAYNPAMKWIMLLRDPCDRAFSHWHMEYQRGQEMLPFPDAIRNEDIRLQMIWPDQDLIASYVDRGFYARQLEHIWSWVPREQTLVLRQDDLKSRPQEVLARICAFLQIPPLPDNTTCSSQVFAQDYRVSMTPEDRLWLQARYEQDINRLEWLLQWNCQSWFQ